MPLEKVLTGDGHRNRSRGEALLSNFQGRCDGFGVDRVFVGYWMKTLFLIFLFCASAVERGKLGRGTGPIGRKRWHCLFI